MCKDCMCNPTTPWREVALKHRINIIGPGDEEEAKDQNYQEYLDIVDGRNVDSTKLLTMIRRQEGCMNRFYDQLFKSFAHGDLAEHPCLWMPHADFLDFCTQTGIIDTSSPDAVRLRQECDLVFIRLTSQRTASVICITNLYSYSWTDTSLGRPSPHSPAGASPRPIQPKPT
jgi:hypothetical protein